jgi:hypothetical protein
MHSTRSNGALKIPVANYKSLVTAWRMHRGPRPAVALRFIVAKPLTDSEFRRLPNALKGLIDFPG